jgi:3-oxoacyl-[acyl-carrier protein] reductase
MDLGLKGRTAVVFGASSGLGLASAEALREEGADVVMVARRHDVLEAEAARLGATAVVADLFDRTRLTDAIESAVAGYGVLDIVVLNGGGPPPGAAEEVTDETVQRAVDLLLRPMVAIVNASLPYLKTSGQGRIISIASVSARAPIPRLALSNAVRPGVWGYLKTLSTELAKDEITVNAVGPGRIATARMTELYGDEPPQAEIDAIPAGRFGTPREVGDVVCFLASRQASYLNGIMVPIDGGLSRAL